MVLNDSMTVGYEMLGTDSGSNIQYTRNRANPIQKILVSLGIGISVVALGMGGVYAYIDRADQSPRNNYPAEQQAKSSQNDNRITVAIPTPTPTVEATPTPEPTVVPLESRIYERLLFEVPEIKEFPKRVTDAVVREINTLYDIRSTEPFNYSGSSRGYEHDEQRTWEFVTSAVRFQLKQLSNIDYAKYKDRPQLSAFESYIVNHKLQWQNYSDEQIGRIVFPTLAGEVNLTKSGSYFVFEINMAIFNFTPNDGLGGLSPADWIVKTMLEDYQNKPPNNDWAKVEFKDLTGLGVYNSVLEWSGKEFHKRVEEKRLYRVEEYIKAFTPYEGAIKMARTTNNSMAYGEWRNPDGSIKKLPLWSNSNIEYQKAVNELLASGDDLYLFLKGYPFTLVDTGRVPSSPSGEQASPRISALLAILLGFDATHASALYPTNPEELYITDPNGLTNHREFYMNTNYGNDDPLIQGMFGFYLKKKPFIQDYEGKPYPTPTISVRSGIGTNTRILP